MNIGGFEKMSLIDYPGHMSAIIFTSGCNFRCPYCHNPELVEETAPLLEQKDIYEFLRTRVGRLEAVSITGGEPTMHADLPDMIRTIRAIGYRIILDSNGTHPDMLKELIDQKLVDYIAMDIKAPIGEYPRITGMPTNFDAIEKSIDLLMSSPIEYEFRTTIIKSLLSPADILQIAQRIKGARLYALQKFISKKILNPQFRSKTTYSDTEFEDMQKTIAPLVTECIIR